MFLQNAGYNCNNSLNILCRVTDNGIIIKFISLSLNVATYVLAQGIHFLIVWFV